MLVAFHYQMMTWFASSNILRLRNYYYFVHGDSKGISLRLVLHSRFGGVGYFIALGAYGKYRLLLQITRSKNKWKFNLKDGIMNLSSKDYVFQKANGEAEWWYYHPMKITNENSVLTQKRKQLQRNLLLFVHFCNGRICLRFWDWRFMQS